MALTNTNALLDQIIGQGWQPGDPPGGRLGQVNASQRSLREYFAELRLGLNAIGNNINLLLRLKLVLQGNIEKLVLELQSTTEDLKRLKEEEERTVAEKDLLTSELADADKKIQVTKEEIDTLEKKLEAINNILADVQNGLEQDKPQLNELQAINESMRDALQDEFQDWAPRQQVGGKRKSKKSKKSKKRKKKTIKKYKRKGRHNKKGGYVYTLRKKGKNKSFKKHRK